MKKKYKLKSYSVPITYVDDPPSKFPKLIRETGIRQHTKQLGQLNMNLFTKKKKKAKLIFVFGSNLAGRHGKGAALKAREEYGAEYGVGKGRTGNAYAIPTKDKKLRPLSLSRIQYYVSQFLYYANSKPNLKFYITRIGCGLAGYSDKDIAPMFQTAPANCILHFKWGHKSRRDA